jgi:hypothetical protein
MTRWPHLSLQCSFTQILITVMRPILVQILLPVLLLAILVLMLCSFHDEIAIVGRLAATPCRLQVAVRVASGSWQVLRRLQSQDCSPDLSVPFQAISAHTYSCNQLCELLTTPSGLLMGRRLPHYVYIVCTLLT